MKSKMLTRQLVAIACVIMLAASMFALAACGDNKAEVPNVVSMEQGDADKALKASGFELGKITYQNSDTLSIGSVVSQSPAAGEKAEKGSAVDLVLSSGKAAPKDVIVPDLNGKTQADAEKALTDVGLVAVVAKAEENGSVAPGLVFKQSIDPGSTVKEGTRVSFTTALAIHEVAVPNLTGMTGDAAKAALQQIGLGYDFTTAYSDQAAEGKVFAQSVNAGSNVKAGTTISVTISLGAKPASNVKVPDVTTYSWTDAQTTLQSAGLDARWTGDPAGIVVSQDIAPGTEVAPGTLVTVMLASDPSTVMVPNLIGMSPTSAEMLTDQIGLGLDSSAGIHGTIIDQYPAAGTMVNMHSTVHITVDTSEMQ